MYRRSGKRRVPILYEPAQTITITPTQLRYIRTTLGLTKKDFAAQLGVTYQSVWNWEGGRTPVGQDNAYRIHAMACARGVDYHGGENDIIQD